MNSLKSINKAQKRRFERRYISTKQAEKILVCDNCKCEFKLKSVTFQEADFVIRGHNIRLTFFTCPKCNKIYKTLISDAHYQELMSDFIGSKETLEKLIKRQASKEMIERHISICDAKHKKVEHYEMKLQEEFPGTFTFRTSENKQKEIIYTERP